MKKQNAIVISEKQAVNMRLSEVEVFLGRAHVEAMPRNLGIVIGNGCNIDCPHCYQVKNGDNLFRDAEIGQHVRRELMSLYPYLSTLRMQGGEVFALRGFKELLDDVAAMAERPLVSISTNATLISEEWADRIVSTPFQHLTVSIDAATAKTYSKVRKGGVFEDVVKNLRYLQQLKQARGVGLPTIDSFFVVMRSNFREIPAFLELLRDLNIYCVTFQVMLIDERNFLRNPDIIDEVIESKIEIVELHQILKQAMEDPKNSKMSYTWAGLLNLFEKHGLDYSFLGEEGSSLTPEKQDVHNALQDPNLAFPKYTYPKLPILPEELGGGHGSRICTNPWYTMFIVENGDVSLCFQAEPVGNLFETPLVEIWNGPKAIAKRSRMLAGRCIESGCSSLWCSWREGDTFEEASPETRNELLTMFKALTSRLRATGSEVDQTPLDSKLRSVRRMLTSRDRRIAELEANLQQLWHDNGQLHQSGQDHIDSLENKIKSLESSSALQKLKNTIKKPN